MLDLSLHILDIVENSIRAGANTVDIFIKEDTANNVFRLEIKDDGIGMKAEMLEKANDPFVTTKSGKKVGLGISLLEQAAHEAHGELDIFSDAGKGTSICATFQNDHIDRKPMGDIKATLLTLLAANPEINFKFTYNNNGSIFIFDCKEIKGQIGTIKINNPEVLRSIKKLLENELIIH